MISLIISVICICVLFYFGGHLISVDDDNVHAAAIIYFTAASISLFSVGKIPLI
jgi:Na+-driven multidrug efflux pump